MAFWICGYAFAFGEGSPVIGLNKFVTIGMPRGEFSFVFFQVISNKLILYNFFFIILAH